MNTKILHGSRDDVIVPDTVKIMFNFDIESIDNRSSIVKNLDSGLVNKKVLMLRSK